MAKDTNLPVVPSLSGEAGLNRYLAEIKKFPLLTPENEYMLAKRYQEHQDPEAARQLVTSHLRLVAKIAMGYRGYGLPVSELISEGNIGLMQGVKKFEPDRGFRLATYAMWWIKASIQEFILRSWSLVKMGTTAYQKKLFFNLRRMKKNIDAYEDGDLRPEDVTKIATDLGVPEVEVINMNRRMMMGGDASLNVSLNEEGEGQWQDLLADERPLQDETVADAEEARWRHALLTEAIATLNERERAILIERRLTDEPKTLEELSQTYNVSRERVRQIEVRAFEKLQKAMQDIASARQLLPAACGPPTGGSPACPRRARPRRGPESRQSSGCPAHGGAPPQRRPGKGFSPPAARPRPGAPPAPPANAPFSARPPAPRPRPALPHPRPALRINFNPFHLETLANPRSR